MFPPCAAGRPGKHHKLFVQRLAFEFHSRNTLKNNNNNLPVPRNKREGEGLELISTPRLGAHWGSGEASGKVSPGIASIWEQFHELLKFDGSSNFSLGYSRTIALLFLVDRRSFQKYVGHLFTCIRIFPSFFLFASNFSPPFFRSMIFISLQAMEINNNCYSLIFFSVFDFRKLLELRKY